MSLGPKLKKVLQKTKITYSNSNSQRQMLVIILHIFCMLVLRAFRSFNQKYVIIFALNIDLIIDLQTTYRQTASGSQKCQEPKHPISLRFAIPFLV